MREPLAPPLVSAPSDQHPCLPTLFLGVDEWYIASCEDVLRNDLVFSKRAMSLHPMMEGRQEQIHILNFLGGKDLLAVCKATNGGSIIVGFEDLVKNKRIQERGIHPTPEGRYRGAIITDDWLDVDEEYAVLASNLFQALKQMYEKGCVVVLAASMGVFSAPQRISAMFQLDSPWMLTAYTSQSLVASPIGKTILGSSFPDKGVYAKVHLVRAPPEERLVVHHIDPDDYDSDDSYVPTPDPSSPLVVHRGKNGACLCYFGFANSLDVSYGAILLKLIHLQEATF